MESEKDLTVIAAVAKSADSYFSPLRDENSFLFLPDLIEMPLKNKLKRLQLQLQTTEIKCA